MASLSPERVAEMHDRYGKPITIDDVIRLRGKDEAQSPILAYPRGNSSIDYELFTGKDIDRFVDQACMTLIDDGFKANDENIVALYAQSDLCYVLTMLALLRMGYKVMTISTRLGSLACRSLLDRVKCKTIVYGTVPRLHSTLADISSERPDIFLRPMLSRSDFDKPEVPWTPFIRPVSNNDSTQKRIALIMHSSGSTGYPKPLFQSHEGVLGDLLTGMGCNAFNPLPWFHLHGLLTSLQAIYMRKTAYLWNSQLPLTADNIITAIRAVEPEIFHGVPYTIKLLSEVPEGVVLLKRCKHVTSGGARPPDELGEKLINEGVRFATTFGLTEAGHIGDSMRREPGDDGWAYLRLHSYVIPHIIFEKIDDSKDNNTYEAVFLKSHPALMMSNSDNPPGSYRSGDIFIPHPTLPHAWKYVARNDDCITLANGEKINPMAMEGVLRQHPLAKDALMFGNDQALPGMMIFQSHHAVNMSNDEYMMAISSALEEANGFADEFARVTPDMVVLVPPEVEYPITDKNNIIRAAAYRIFDDRIRAVYAGSTNGFQCHNEQRSSETRLRLDVQGLEQYIVDRFKSLANVDLGTQDDFFSAGVDSLMAIQIRRSLQRDIDVGNASLPTNVVYDSRNAYRLARLLYGMRTEDVILSNISDRHHTDVLEEMKYMIDRYGSFIPRTVGGQPKPQEDVVVLTGATGALGAHLLHLLLQRSSVRHVYCLVRSLSADPRSRVLESFRQRGIEATEMTVEMLEKFSVHHTRSLGDDGLGVPQELYHELRSRTTMIVHAAWPVHFKLPLASFEPHIAGVRNLLELAINTPWKEPARVSFASSVATAYATPRLPDGTVDLIAEGPIPSLSHTLGTGYAQSKLVSEKICERAANVGVKTAVLRIGQIVGDVEKGVWNPKEAIPLMIRSALVIKTLPRLEGEHDSCEWMPVDTMAAACLQVGDVMRSTAPDMSDNGSGALNGRCNNNHAFHYNLVSPHSHSWNVDVLPALRRAGLQFEEVSLATWLANIKSFGAGMEENAALKLPAIKLMDYYQKVYADPNERASIARFDVSKGSRDLAALRDCPKIVEDGLIAKFLGAWMELWNR